MKDAQMPESLKVLDTPHGAWLWEFLDGTSGYMGVFFGEPHPKHGGRYWWRRFVREEVSALQSALKDRDAEIERLKKDAERYRWLSRKVSAHGVIDGWAFGFPTHLTLPAPSSAIRDPQAALGEAIDAAIDSMKGDA